MPKSALDLPIPLSLKPMEAEPVDDLPRGKGWLYEPKYDGFRCRNEKSLTRFFPEVAAGLARLGVERFVLDGELVVPGQSFETLQLRLHPAASRVADLSDKISGAAGRVRSPGLWQRPAERQTAG